MYFLNLGVKELSRGQTVQWERTRITLDWFGRKLSCSLIDLKYVHISQSTRVMPRVGSYAHANASIREGTLFIGGGGGGGMRWWFRGEGHQWNFGVMGEGQDF